MASRYNCTKHAIINPAQIRAARALLGWSRETLSERSGVSLRTLVSIEAGEANPRDETLTAIRDTLVKAGIKIIKRNGGGDGVRFRHRTQSD